MPKLEVLLTDGGIEEFETVPVEDGKKQNSAMPAASNQGSSILKTAVLLRAGQQIMDSGINQIGELTGDYALERKIKGYVTGSGYVTGLVAYTIPTAIAIGVKEGTDFVVRQRSIYRKQIKAAENRQRIGKVVSNNARLDGAK